MYSKLLVETRRKEEAALEELESRKPMVKLNAAAAVETEEEKKNTSFKEIEKIEWEIKATFNLILENYQFFPPELETYIADPAVYARVVKRIGSDTHGHGMWWSKRSHAECWSHDDGGCRCAIDTEQGPTPEGCPSMDNYARDYLCKAQIFIILFCFIRI